MMLSTKQTAHDLLSEHIDTHSNDTDKALCLPDAPQDFFAEHFERLPTTCIQAFSVCKSFITPIMNYEVWPKVYFW